jgi:hypothetical protein
MKALHVGGAAAIEPAVAFDDGERIIGPCLVRHRDNVGVTGEHDPTGRVGSDGGEQAGLGAVGVGDQMGLDPLAAEDVGDEADQFQIGLRRSGIERHQSADEIDGRGRTRHWFNLARSLA